MRRCLQRVLDSLSLGNHAVGRSCRWTSRRPKDGGGSQPSGKASQHTDVAALFPSDCALPFDRMLVDPKPPTRRPADGRFPPIDLLPNEAGATNPESWTVREAPACFQCGGRDPVGRPPNGFASGITVIPERCRHRAGGLMSPPRPTGPGGHRPPGRRVSSEIRPSSSEGRVWRRREKRHRKGSQRRQGILQRQRQLPRSTTNCNYLSIAQLFR